MQCNVLKCNEMNTSLETMSLTGKHTLDEFVFIIYIIYMYYVYILYIYNAM